MVLEHLTEKEKQLVALCIEFEGSVFIDKSNNTVNIVVQCTDRKLLEKFGELVKCGDIWPKNDVGYKVARTSLTKKRFFVWRVKGTAKPKYKCRHIAYDFYKEIDPYLITKKLK